LIRQKFLVIFWHGSNPRRFVMSPKNGGDLCAHRAGGASTYRFVCALAQSIFLSYHCPPPKPQSFKLPPTAERKRLPRPKGADETRRLVVSRIVLEKSSDFVQETQPSFRIRFFAKMRSAAKRRNG